MIKQIIKFLGGHGSGIEIFPEPLPIIKTLPKWYKDFPKFLKNENQKHMTVKSCVPFFDALTMGYTFTTPCDIEFYVEDNTIKHKVLDERFIDFIGPRSPMPGFADLDGFYEEHFYWLPAWSVQLPEGYSALYVHPLNRFELPFMTTNGIIDNDKISIPGQLPFFLKKNFKGIVPKGTPIVQIIPFKRENWVSENIKLDAKSHELRMQESTSKYKNIEGTKNSVYRYSDWEQKRYE